MKVNQLVEIYLSKNLRGSHYRSRVEEVTPASLTIAMPFDKGRPIFLSPGSPVYGKIITDAAPYLFTSRYLDKKMVPIPVWIIAFPAELIKIQQREFVRIDTKLSVIVNSVDSTDETEPVKLLVNDISGGGIRVVSPQAYPLHTRLSLTLDIPGQGLFEAEGEIVRIEQPQQERDIFWIGIKFLGVRERERNKIIKYVFQKQLDRHRRGF